MKIQVRERLRPFTHRPGSWIPIPGTHRLLQAFPTLLRIVDERGELEEIACDRGGVVEQFTATLDLEKGWILLSGRSQSGFFRTYVSASGISESAPKALSHPKERLSFGVHRKQEWDAALRRGDLQELLPFLVRLGQMTPQAAPFEGGTASLLSNWPALLRAGFGGLLAPRLYDEEHQGYSLPPLTREGSPFFLLTEGARRVRSCFFREEKGALYFLPEAPPLFRAGRMTDIALEGLTLHFEWTKGKMRRALIKSSEEIVQRVIFPREIKRFRVNGREQSADAPLILEKEKLTLLDRFEK